MKSCKGAWLETCFVPAEAGEAEFQEVCHGLVERRGERFTGGIVIRPLIPLVFKTAHSSGAPLFEEYRPVF
ncbi:MAG: hypothetical protein CMO80_16565 [Verrucomicrobiales bacterium]|nr:hypothetical protein [Verrucomicrobiales bacterium]